MYDYSIRLIAYFLFISLFTLSLNGCAAKFGTVKKSMNYIKSGDLKQISEDEKRPLVVPINGTSDYNENIIFAEVSKTLNQLRAHSNNIGQQIPIL